MSTEALRLWQLISPSLPVGGFHYSQGLEQAVQRGWVAGAEDAHTWISGVLAYALAWSDLPLIQRVHEAWCERDLEAVRHWNAVSRACRETSELRDAEFQMGAALVDLAASMDEPMPDGPLGFTAAFAVLSANNAIAARDAMAGYAWAWCENQSLVATKLLPLGHREGQRVLRRLSGGLDQAVATAAQVPDARIGRSAFGVALASSAHETQYSRMFRS